MASAMRGQHGQPRCEGTDPPGRVHKRRRQLVQPHTEGLQFAAEPLQPQRRPEQQESNERERVGDSSEQAQSGYSSQSLGNRKAAP
jgi:hypothetical protein